MEAGVMPGFLGHTCKVGGPLPVVTPLTRRLLGLAPPPVSLKAIGSRSIGSDVSSGYLHPFFLDVLPWKVRDFHWSFPMLSTLRIPRLDPSNGFGCCWTCIPGPGVFLGRQIWRTLLRGLKILSAHVIPIKGTYQRSFCFRISEGTGDVFFFL